MLFSKFFQVFGNHVRETDRNRRTAAADKEVTRRGLPSYRQVQDGEISYEEAVLELADHMGWALDTAYKAAYPETYITGALKNFVSPKKELEFASMALAMSGNPCAAFLENAGQEISLYDLVLEGEKLAGHPLAVDAAWREPFYRFASELAQNARLSIKAFRAESEYDTLFHYIGECLQIYATKHPVDEMGIPLEFSWNGCRDEDLDIESGEEGIYALFEEDIEGLLNEVLIEEVGER